MCKRIVACVLLITMLFLLSSCGGGNSGGGNDSGDKTMEEVVRLIQARVTIYINEQKK